MSSSAPPRPSSRQHPSSPFAWQTTAQAPRADRRAEAACAELAHRAGLLYRLGFSVEAATARLAQRVAWEFDPGARGAHRRPDALSDAAVAKIVADTYARKPG